MRYRIVLVIPESRDDPLNHLHHRSVTNSGLDVDGLSSAFEVATGVVARD